MMYKNDRFFFTSFEHLQFIGRKKVVNELHHQNISKTMNDRNMKLIFGVAAGAALGYWLNSDQGRRVRAQAKDTSLETLDKVKSVAAEQVDQAKSTIGKVVEQGVEITQSALQRMQSTTNEQVNRVQSTMHESLAKGVKKAKRHIDELNHQLENQTA